MTDEAVVERLPPGEAFKRVAHETRFEILRALSGADDPVAFSALRDRVGVNDPGRLNYHLDELVGRFVDRTDDGYRLTTPGMRIVGAILSGGYTKAMEAEPVPVDAECFVCDRRMAVRFEEHRVRVTCDFCGFDFAAPAISPGAIEGRSREEVPAVVDGSHRRILTAAAHGFCHFCDGPIERRARLAGEEAAPDWVDGGVFEAIVVNDCSKCGHRWPTTFDVAIVTHPAVIAFHYEHGIDLRETRLWNLPWMDVGLATVERRDPLRVAVPVALEAETAVFVVDVDLELVEERRKAGDGT